MSELQNLKARVVDLESQVYDLSSEIDNYENEMVKMKMEKSEGDLSLPDLKLLIDSLFQTASLPDLIKTNISNVHLSQNKIILTN